MSITTSYVQFAVRKLDEVLTAEEQQIEAAATLVAQSCMNGGRFYVFGSGHSHMIAEELYLRAGGLALVKGILPPELMLHEMANKSTLLERLDGYGSALLQLYEVDEKDTLLVISNSGRNPVPVELCLSAKEKGVNVIVITSLKHSQVVTSRHKSGKKIYEIADVVIDNHGEKGDAGYPIEGLESPVGSTSSITGITIAQAMVSSAVAKMVSAGYIPPVFKSSNLDGADAYNEELFKKYHGYWK